MNNQFPTQTVNQPDFTRAALPQLSTEARALFEKEVHESYPLPVSHPFHNWDRHITEVLAAVHRFCDLLERLGRKPDREVLETAAKSHDGWYAADHASLGFKTKEALAAHNTKQLLLKLGASEEFANRVAEAILDTDKSRDPQTLEGKILRAADLSGLALDREAFEAGTKLLHVEFQNGRGRSIEYRDFVKWQLGAVLADYLAATIYLTPHATDANGRSIWHKASLGNIQQVYWNAPTIAMFNPSELPGAFYERRELSGGELIVGVSSEKNLRAELDFLRNWKGKLDAPALVVPGTSVAASIPDKSCEEVHVVFDPVRPDVSELVRITQPGGRIFLYLSENHSSGQQLLTEYMLNLASSAQLMEVTNLGGWKALVFITTDKAPSTNIVKSIC